MIPPNHRVSITRGFWKRERSPSPAGGRTPHHTTLLTVRCQLAMEDMTGIVDCAASAPVVGKRLTKKLEVWKRPREVNVRQGAGSHLSVANVIVNTSFKVFDFVSSATSTTVLAKFTLDAEVLDVGNKDCILGLS